MQPSPYVPHKFGELWLKKKSIPSALIVAQTNICFSYSLSPTMSKTLTLYSKTLEQSRKEGDTD